MSPPPHPEGGCGDCPLPQQMLVEVFERVTRAEENTKHTRRLVEQLEALTREDLQGFRGRVLAVERDTSRHKTYWNLLLWSLTTLVTAAVAATAMGYF